MADWRKRYVQHVQHVAVASTADPSGHDEAEDDDRDLVDVDPALLTEKEASEVLRKYLISMKMSSRVFSARAVCTIAFLATKAGATGSIESLALNPRASGGRASEKFDNATGLADLMRDRTIDVISIPGHDRKSIGRSTTSYATSLVYDTLASEIAETRNFDAMLADTLDNLGSVYADARVVREHPDVSFIPLALYQDGVAFQWDKKDGAMGFWFVNLVTGRRHLALVTRKRHKCQCGCGGWCSMFYCYKFMSWLMQVMLAGHYPHARCDGAAWNALHDMSSLAGQPLGYRAAVIMIKGDWMEYSSSFGFSNWQSHDDPCFLCLAKGGPAAPPSQCWRRVDGITPLGLPWLPKGPAWYEAVCAACEHPVHVKSRGLFCRLIGSLEKDRRKKGSRGRRLMKNFDELGLRIGMRVEPCDAHWDVFAIDDYMMNWPLGGVHLLFWNPSAERGAHHRNPIFCDATGVDVSMMAADELHTMFLGVLGDYASSALWQIIQEDALQVGDALNESDSFKLRGERLQAELADFYRRRAAADQPVNEIKDFVYNVIGHQDDPKYSGQAAPCGDLFRFSVEMVERHHRLLARGQALLSGGRALLEYLRVTRSTGWRLSVGDHQALVDSFVRFRGVADAAGVRFRPKHHLYAHLVVSAQTFGNPRLATSTWVDEGLNSQLAAVAKHSHSLVWSKRILASFQHALGPVAVLMESCKRRRKTS